MTQWCTECDRPVDGEVCGVCGQAPALEARAPLPWRWRFFLLASVVYLVWRVYQLVTWLT